LVDDLGFGISLQIIYTLVNHEFDLPGSTLLNSCEILTTLFLETLYKAQVTAVGEWHDIRMICSKSADKYHLKRKKEVERCCMRTEYWRRCSHKTVRMLDDRFSTVMHLVC